MAFLGDFTEIICEETDDELVMAVREMWWVKGPSYRHVY